MSCNKNVTELKMLVANAHLSCAISFPLKQELRCVGFKMSLGVSVYMLCRNTV